MCNKTRYSTEEFAREDLKRFSKNKRSNKPTGVYFCTKCGTWHLTSDNGVLFDKIKELNKTILELRIKIKKGNEQNEALQNVLKEIRLNYQPIKNKIHNGTNKRSKRNGRK